jgi:hypothetical protein
VPKRLAGAALTVAAVLLTAGPAQAHRPRSFDSCASNRRHGPCSSSATYTQGDRIFLHARVEPPHARQDARLSFLRPGAEFWRAGPKVRVSATGRLHWFFRSDIVYVDRDDPWTYRFLIPGHGRSDVTEFWVLPDRN